MVLQCIIHNELDALKNKWRIVRRQTFSISDGTSGRLRNFRQLLSFHDRMKIVIIGKGRWSLVIYFDFGGITAEEDF